MQKPDLILFDWDRTLCDIEAPTNEILKETFRVHWNTIAYPEFIRIFRSPENQWRKVRDRLEEILWKIQWGHYYETFIQIKRNSSIKPTIFWWIREQLEKIREIPNRIVGIVSNKNERDIMEDGFWEISSQFEFIIGWDRVPSSELKPSWKLIEIAIETIWSINTVLMIWDACHDMNALWNAHFVGKKFWVLSTWGITREEAILQNTNTQSLKLNTFQELSSVRNLSQTIHSLLTSQ